MCNHSFDKAYSTNIIYVYTLDEASHKDCAKVGKASIAKANPTQEEVEKAAKSRIDAQLGTAGLKYKSFYAESAIRNDSDGVPHSFMDHEVHKVLERSGIKKKRLGTGAQEWFECSVETAKAAIRAVKENRQALDAAEIKNDFEPIRFRPEQLKAIEQTKKVFAKENDMLWNAKMRFGKTVTSLQVVKEMGFGRTLIFTHRPVVVKGWHEDFQKIFFNAEDYAFGSKMEYGSDLAWLEKNEKKYVFFASIQDLRGSEQVGGNFAKNQELYDTQWDCIIIDEAHEGTLTALGESVFESLKKPNTKVLRLSGTPFNLLDKFSSANTYTWDYVMEQRAKAQWEQEHPDEPNPYAMLPSMCIYTYDISRLLRSDDVEEGSVFSFKEFFRTDGDFDRFVHEDRVKAFLDLLVENDADSLYPFSNERFENTFRHTLWMVPGVKAARAISDLLKKHETFGKYGIVNVAGDGDEEEERDEALHKVESAIGKDPTKTRTITLSCGKLTTGVSVPAWTGVLMLSGSVNTSASAYMQTIFRVQTPCDIGGLQKEICYVFDFAPDRTLQILADVAHVESVGKGTTETERQTLSDFLKFCPVISYDNSQLRQYDTDLLFQKMKRVFIERVVKSGFEDDHIYNQQKLRGLNADEAAMFEKLRARIGSTKAMPKTKGIGMTDSGLDGEEQKKGKGAKSGKGEKGGLPEEQKKRIEQQRLERDKAKAAASILRGISIRMPLMVYGANLKDEKKELTIKNFTELVDNESWKEFMPDGVSKGLFKKFSKYFDEDIFAAASLRIRDLAREADEMNPEERIEQIYTIFNYFRNPDKETVLTPPRVVNMHMGDTLGGWNFYQKTDEVGNTFYDDEQVTAPEHIEVEGVTDEVFATNSRILEINSKSGLYPLYVTYSIYRKRLEQAAKKLTLKEQHNVWDETVASNIFVVCKTPMAAAITRRTLCGFRKVQCNAKHYPNLLTEIKNKQSRLIARLRMGKTFWGANAYDNMKFNAVVGNPPYQEMKSTDKTITNAAFASAIYPYFIDLSRKISQSLVSLITPSRWMTKVGQGISDDWVDELIKGNQFMYIHDYLNSESCFSNVSIKGGVNYFLLNSNYRGKCKYILTTQNNTIERFDYLDPIGAGVVIRDQMAISIINAVSRVDGEYFINKSFRAMVSPKHFFDKDELLSSNWRGYETAQDDSHYIKLYVNRNLESCGYGWIAEKDIPRNKQVIPYHKVFIPKVGGSGTDPNVLGKPFYGEPNSVCSYTYLVIGYEQTDNTLDKPMCEAILKYVQSKFFRYLVSIKKKTQDNARDVFQFVPIQDFSANSDIDWSKSVSEIDVQLYSKYGLKEEEIGFIESMIKPME